MEVQKQNIRFDADVAGTICAFQLFCPSADTVAVIESFVFM